MSSYYNSYYGETRNDDGSTSYYNSYYGETRNGDGSTSYYNDYYGETRNGDGSTSYYNGYYGDSTSYSSYDGGSSYSDDSSGEGCFITTACVKAKGFSDDCFELSILRKYRDKLVKEDDNINKVVKGYYRTAPQLVEILNKQPNKQDIYEHIYNELVVKSIGFLIDGEYYKAVDQYKKVYEELIEKYKS